MEMLKKIWNILDLSQRKRSFYILLITLISMFLEILGVGLTIPAITLLIKADLINEYPFLKPIISVLGNPSHFNLVVIGMSLLVFIYFIKNLFYGFFNWYSNKFSYDIKVEVSQKLFENYLNQPYIFHLRRNSAQLIRNIEQEVSSLQGALFMIITLIIEILVFLGVVILLIYIEPLGAMIVGAVIVLVIWMLNIKIKKYFEMWGLKQQETSGLSKQHLMQGLGGVKEIKLLGREKNFFSLHYFYTAAANHYQVLFNFVNTLPRLFFEILTLLGVTGLVISMMYQNKPNDIIIVTLGLFAMAAFRLMPSTNRIVTSIQTLWYCKAGVNLVYNELNLLKNISTSNNLDIKNSKLPKISKGSLISLKNISFAYPSTKKLILDNANLNFNQGETIGLIGPSGSGKTTLIDIFLGLLHPDEGEIKLDNINVFENLRSWQNQIGYVPQSIYLTDDSLKKNIALGLNNSEINISAVNKAIKSAELNEMINNLPEGLETKCGERGVRLSGGQKQRIGIARALYHDPEILVLDEATSSLDNQTEASIVDTLKEIKGKKTILIIAHRLSTIKHCDRLIKINNCKILDEAK